MSGVLDVGSVHQDALVSVVALSDANGARAASSIRKLAYTTAVHATMIPIWDGFSPQTHSDMQTA